MVNPIKIIGLVGSPRAGGKTEALVRHVLDAAGDQGDAEGTVIVLGESALATPNGTRAEAQTGSTRALLDAVERADAVILGTPIYRATFSSMLKQSLDLIPHGGYDGDTAPLRGKPVAVVATGALPHHFLGVDPLVSILISFFGAWVVPPPLYGHAGEFDDSGGVLSSSLASAIPRLGRALVSLARAIEQAPALRAVEPQL